MQATIRQGKLFNKFARFNGSNASPQGGYQVYVGGVAWAATNEDIRRHFSDCGNVISVSVYILMIYLLLI